MRLLPYDSWSIESPLQVRILVIGITARIEPRKWFRGLFKKHHLAIQGTVSDQGLTASRIIHYRNSFAIVLVVGVVIGYFVSGCAGTKLKRLSGQEFLDQANQIGQLNSFHWTSYIGRSPGRAYLEFGYPAPFGKGSRTTVYWAPLSELPADLSSQLKIGNPPWQPWRPETNRMERTKPRTAP